MGSFLIPFFQFAAKPFFPAVRKILYGFLFSVTENRVMAGIDFRAVRALVSMAEVLELLGFQARVISGQQLRGPCPIHGSEKDSRSFVFSNRANEFFGLPTMPTRFESWHARTRVPKGDCHVKRSLSFASYSVGLAAAVSHADRAMHPGGPP
jgi:hypothetical protein